MKKKIALVLTSLLMLTLLLTTSHFALPVTAPDGPYHWKIELAQKKCNAYIAGSLVDVTGAPIPDTEFELNCTCEDPDPQPHSQRVYWKVATDVIPAYIVYFKYVDWNKDGIWDEIDEVFGDLVEPEEGHRWYHHQQERNLTLFPMGPVNLSDPVCSEWEGVPNMPPFAGLWHLSSWHDSGWPYGNLSYCDEVDLTPLDVPGPVDWWHVKKVSYPGPVLLLDQMVVVEVHQTEISHQWQLTLKQHNCSVYWAGILTNEMGDPIPGTDFEILCNCTTLQCTVVRTPNCTLVGDIEFDILVFSKNDTEMLYPIDIQLHYEIITQFPWTMAKNGTDPFTGDKWTVELELTEVQMHHYTVMGGWCNTAGQIGAFPLWDLDAWQIHRGVPFATREPYLTPMIMGQNITFTQRDPITGIVELGIPAESYVGLDHIYYSPDFVKWFRFEIFLEQQGCGWIFTEEGKEPVLGCVDLCTYNNYSGVWTYGPDQIPKTPDDELLAGELYGPGTESAGAGPPIGPCLQLLRGSDGIPGTGDDPIGRGDPDGPNPPGSSIVFLPTTLNITYWDELLGWQPMVQLPWPQLLTTGTANDTVIEPASPINGATAEQTGQPWEYFAGLDHPTQQVPWKDPKCNAYVHYVSVWSVLRIPTAFGNMDMLFEFEEKKVRDDHVIPDVNCDEIVDFKDLYLAARAFVTEDEGIGPDGVPDTGDDKPVADPYYDARCDVFPDGIIDIIDLVVVALDYDFVPGYHVPDTWQGTISAVPLSPCANVGETFEVNLNVSGVTDLYLVLFCIRWNPAVLSLTGTPTPGDFLPGTPFSVYARINHTGGYLEAWTGTITGSGPGASGSGTVAKLEFEVLSVSLNYSLLDLYDCSWMDSATGQYGFTAIQDGVFAPWNVNNDTVVDIEDLTIVSLALWAEPGKPKWNPDADVNCDNIIDIEDLTIVSLHLWENW